MNEKVLDTLMQIFASIAKEDVVTKEEVNVIRTFLYTQLTDETAAFYMKRFGEYVDSDYGINVETLCAEVNPELTATQKFYILIRLLEMVGADQIVSMYELEIIEQVLKGFNISHEDYEPLLNFITTDKPRQLLLRNMLIISSGRGSLRGKHLMAEHFVGYVAVLHVEDVDLYVLRYMGNGQPVLNGQPILSGPVHILTPGSVIRAPRCNPVYFSDVVSQFWEAHHEQRITFDAAKVKFVFPNGHVGLHNVDVAEHSGRLVALMGASGAGKSTLLNVLNGSYAPTEGQVSINGLDVHKNKDKLKGVIGHVAQDDLLIEELTVWQNLYYNAKLCFGEQGTLAVRNRVEQTLQELGLLEIKDLKVGSPLNKKISGGQRKRLNIALELIREPAVLFVDEPTSGLSSRDSENVMDLLKELSLRGKLVFVVIHQPSSEIFKMFDSLLMLDTGGYPIYYGNPLEGIRYFRGVMDYPGADQAECQNCGNVTPEEIFNIVETRLVDEYGQLSHQRKVPPIKWHQLYLEHHQPRHVAPEAEPPRSNLHLPSKFKQLGLFFRRDLLSKLANRAYLAVNLLEPPLLALALAWILRYNSITDHTARYTLFGNVNLPAYILTCILVALFLGLTVSAEEILRDRKIRKRERFLNLSRHSYLASKVLLLFGLAAIQTLIFIIIGNGIMEIRGLTPDYWLMLFTLCCFANMLGLNISSAFDNAVTIYVLIPIILIPQIVLSGALVPFDKLNRSLGGVNEVPLVGNMMASRWAYEGLAVQQHTRNLYERNFFEADRAIEQADFRLNNWLPAMEAKMDYLNYHYQEPADAEAVRTAAQLVGQELQLAYGAYADAPPAFLGEMAKGQASEELLRQANNSLIKLRQAYSNAFSKARKDKDAIITTLKEDGYELNGLRERHHNKRLEETMTGSLESEPLVEFNGRFVPLVDAVYRKQQHASLGGAFKAHFYVPRKQIGPYSTPTYWFNTLLIWLMSVVLYWALYWDLLRKGITALGRLGARLGALGAFMRRLLPKRRHTRQSHPSLQGSV